MKKSLKLNAVYKKSGKWIIAWVEEIPGVNTQGRTMKEARVNLREALSLILQEKGQLARKQSSILTREQILIPCAC
ncbi:MAG: type II toxin-antitoxin system HicB family antitoxin [Candidatus Vogelbacteria bacterium]|nr:type II toxin-antitoxin system HicB family antitoxin [Candidatus Vogelbacteria bacterium]